MDITLIRVPCEDGAEYDLYVAPPEGMPIDEALQLVEESVNEYFASSGEAELIPALEAQGFQCPTIFDTQATW